MNEVQIMLGGQQRTLLFDIGTLKLMSREADAQPDPSNLIQVAADNLLKACYYGLLRTYKVQKKDPDFDLATVEDWVDSLSVQEGMAVLKVYNSAFQIKNEEDSPTAPAADKKK